MGKDGAVRPARWDVEAGARAADVRAGSGARPVGLLLGATGTVSLWSSLLSPWKTSPARTDKGSLPRAGGQRI